jgi:hypothetical protein
MKRRGGSQRDDESVGGAGDHGPGAGVDGVDVPLGHQPLVVPHPALHRHQRRHCETETRGTVTTRIRNQTQPNHTRTFVVEPLGRERRVGRLDDPGSSGKHGDDGGEEEDRDSLPRRHGAAGAVGKRSASGGGGGSSSGVVVVVAMGIILHWGVYRARQARVCVD